MLELYHHGSSACAAKVRFALAEKQLPWTGRYIDILAGLCLSALSRVPSTPNLPRMRSPRARFKLESAHRISPRPARTARHTSFLQAT
jgi:hypothetical protein